METVSQVTRLESGLGPESPGRAGEASEVLSALELSVAGTAEPPEMRVPCGLVLRLSRCLFSKWWVTA